ncbi:MAG TPA: hypothetical protein VFG23_13245 [Polyangia bacterium]|nr:hypothetical protein [Polyangia bacterium]
MPGLLRLTVSVDVTELSRDLRSFGDDLDRPLRDALEYGAKTIAVAAKPLMRYRANTWKNSSGARYGPINSYYAARVATTSASVVSDHPAAPVWEFGGHIDPAAGGGEHRVKAELRQRAVVRQRIRMAGGRKGIEIPALHPVGRAAEASRQDITQHLEDALTALVREHGLDG